MKISTQQELLEELAQYVDESVGAKYEQATCKFTVTTDVGDGSISVGTQLTYLNGIEHGSAFLKAPNGRKFLAVKELHKIMQEHTGGSWKSFELFVLKDDKITASFHY